MKKAMTINIKKSYEVLMNIIERINREYEWDGGFYWIGIDSNSVCVYTRYGTEPCEVVSLLSHSLLDAIFDTVCFVLTKIKDQQ